MHILNTSHFAVLLFVMTMLFTSSAMAKQKQDEDARACSSYHDLILQRAAQDVIEQRYPYVPEPFRAQTLKQRRSPKQPLKLAGLPTTQESFGDLVVLKDGRALVVQPTVGNQPSTILTFRLDKQNKLVAGPSIVLKMKRVKIAATNSRLVVISQHTNNTMAIFDISKSVAKRLKTYSWTGQVHHLAFKQGHVYAVTQHQVPGASVRNPALDITPKLAKTLPPVVDKTIVGRWPKLYNSRTHQERQRAMKVLLGHYAQLKPLKNVQWPVLNQIDAKDKTSQMPLLSCQQLVVPDAREVNALVSMIHVHVQHPESINRLGVLTSFIGGFGHELMVRWTKSAMYLVHLKEDVARLLDKKSHRITGSNATRVFKFAPAPKTGQMTYKAMRDVVGELWSTDSWQTQREDIHLWLMTPGKAPNFLSLTENPARKRLEVVHSLGALKKNTIVHSVHVTPNVLYVVHSLPQRLSIFDVRDMERPKKKSDVALDGQTLAMIALNEKKIWRLSQSNQKAQRQDRAALWSTPKLDKPVKGKTSALSTGPFLPFERAPLLDTQNKISLVAGAYGLKDRRRQVGWSLLQSDATIIRLEHSVSAKKACAARKKNARGCPVQVLMWPVDEVLDSGRFWTLSRAALEVFDVQGKRLSSTLLPK